MAKKTDKTDPQEKARRALVKAQLKLEVAQEEHTQQRVRGQQEVEKARLRAQKWLAKAAQRVERRAEAVAQAEGALASLTAAPKPAPSGGQAGKRRRVSRPARAQAAPDVDSQTPAAPDSVSSVPNAAASSRQIRRRSTDQPSESTPDA